MDAPPHAAFIVAMAVAAVAAAFDLRRGLIPSWLTLGALVLGPLFHAGRMLAMKAPMDAALTEGGLSALGAVATGLVPMLLYRQGAIGGGDVKLLAALGAWLQPMVGVEAELYGFMTAVVVAPAQLAYEGKLFLALKNAFVILTNFFVPKARRREVDEVTLSWFKLAPPLFFGVVLSSYLHW